MTRAYLGDSVYVETESALLKLTTDYGIGPTNTIYLGPEVLDALITYAFTQEAAMDHSIRDRIKATLVKLREKLGYHDEDVAALEADLQEADEGAPAREPAKKDEGQA